MMQTDASTIYQTDILGNPQVRPRVLSVDEQVAHRAALLHVPDPAPEAGAYIAATALVHGLTLATRNIPDFAWFRSLPVVNPWA